MRRIGVIMFSAADDPESQVRAAGAKTILIAFAEMRRMCWRWGLTLFLQLVDQ
jgi:hypothetical protein